MIEKMMTYLEYTNTEKHLCRQEALRPDLFGRLTEPWFTAVARTFSVLKVKIKPSEISCWNHQRAGVCQQPGAAEVLNTTGRKHREANLDCPSPQWIIFCVLYTAC